MTQTGRNGSRRTQRMRFAVLGGMLTVAIAVIIAVFVLNRPSNNESTAVATWSTQSHTGGPRLAVDRTLVDHGSVAYNHEVRATYRLKNVGDQPLNLQRPTVEVAEGC